MAQLGFTPILIYGSTVATNVPLNTNLTTSANGVELAINATDGRLFYKDNAGVVQVLATRAVAAGTLPANSTVGGIAIGFRDMAQITATNGYTLVLSDSAKQILTSTSGGTYNIPSNASVAYPIGTVITFINLNAAASFISILGGDTLTLAGSVSTGTRQILQNGIATIIKIAATSWLITGTGLV
jgi:hypothetical protein